MQMFVFALSYMNVAVVDSQVFPGKEASWYNKGGINSDSVHCTQWSVGNVVQKHHNSECMVQGLHSYKTLQLHAFKM